MGELVYSSLGLLTCTDYYTSLKIKISNLVRGLINQLNGFKLLNIISLIKADSNQDNLNTIAFLILFIYFY